MTMTINSGSASYATAAQFVTLVDWRAFGQLASDTDVPLASSSALQSSPILAAVLQVAAGDIEMAATVGQRYQPTDLTALITPTITNGGWTLIEMNVFLAAAKMFERRFESIPDFLVKKVDDARAKLAALEAGTEVFPFSETQAAGIASDYQETQQDVANRNLPSYVARRCLGNRDNTLPYGTTGS